ncbi:MAG: M20/M25/M40 family metallo-hydrolase [Thiohalospira sp.]
MVQKRIFQAFVIVILTGLSSCTTTTLNSEITETNLFKHIDFLASDSLKGRFPGTDEDRVAAEYIASTFSQTGLDLFFGNGLQEFEITTEIEAGKNNRLQFNEELFRLRDDYMPISFSASDSIEAEVVFVGYGFNINEKELKWNNYENINVKDKIVLILRGEPQNDELDFSFSLYSGLRTKAITAKDMGAAGVIFVSGPQFDENDELLLLDKPEGKLDIPVIQIKRDIANKLLMNKNTTIERLEKLINKNQSPNSFNTGKNILLQTDVQTNPRQTFNVAAQLTTGKNNRYIVIGAHYDHLGFGGHGTGSRMPNTKDVHYGADDNASGVAALLEIAQKLASKKDSLNNNFIFVAFGAEEMGLIGSKHFVNNLPVADSLILAMINIDMVGRLRQDRSLQIGGTGTSLEADSILHLLNTKYNFKLGLSEEGYGPSDHSSFYSKDIPVFFYSTGAHIDYHTSNDTIGAINFDGLVEVTNFIYDLAFNLSSQNVTLTFSEAGPKSPGGDFNRREMKVSLGIMPDFSGVEKRGLRADLVIKGKPADKAGMESGDIIVAMDGLPVGDVYEYMERLNQFKPGQIITVEVIRNEEKKVLIIQL